MMTVEKVVTLVIRLILIAFMFGALFLSWKNGGFQLTVIFALAILIVESIMDDL